MTQTKVLGVRVDCIDMSLALSRIEALIDEGGPHLVATVNPEFVMRTQHDADFARVLDSASICLPDGTGVVWAARRNGCAIDEPVTGTDLILPLVEMCARRGFRLFLLGASDGVADQLAAILRTAQPSLQVASHSGSPDPRSDTETLKRIHEHRAQVLLVAYGAPNQEMWIDRLSGSLGVAVAVGVGGAFDYLTGRVRRAPRWMRRAGLEWLHRLAVQPWRIKRMAVLPVYVIKVLRAGNL